MYKNITKKTEVKVELCDKCGRECLEVAIENNIPGRFFQLPSHYRLRQKSRVEYKSPLRFHIVKPDIEPLEKNEYKYSLCLNCIEEFEKWLKE